MAKQKYVKVQVNIAVGNRKSQIVWPVEVDEDANTFDGELNVLFNTFMDAVKALPTFDRPYTLDDIEDTICECLELQSKHPEVRMAKAEADAGETTIPAQVQANEA